ncbi:Tropomyosin [Halotydeus destructor]|nr:Tropomyosin [Halotydeus destructor]
MEAIKKKMAALKIEKDNAMDKMETAESTLREANSRCYKANEEIQGLVSKSKQIDNDLVLAQEELARTTTNLEDKEKSLTNAEAEMASLNRKVQQLIEDLDKSEDKTKIAVAKMEQAFGGLRRVGAHAQTPGASRSLGQ